MGSKEQIASKRKDRDNERIENCKVDVTSSVHLSFPIACIHIRNLFGPNVSHGFGSGSARSTSARSTPALL